jgi:hypothetical protein
VDELPARGTAAGWGCSSYGLPPELRMLRRRLLAAAATAAPAAAQEARQEAERMPGSRRRSAAAAGLGSPRSPHRLLGTPGSAAEELGPGGAWSGGTAPGSAHLPAASPAGAGLAADEPAFEEQLPDFELPALDHLPELPGSPLQQQGQQPGLAGTPGMLQPSNARGQQPGLAQGSSPLAEELAGPSSGKEKENQQRQQHKARSSIAAAAAPELARLGQAAAAGQAPECSGHAKALLHALQQQAKVGGCCGALVACRCFQASFRRRPGVDAAHCFPGRGADLLPSPTLHPAGAAGAPRQPGRPGAGEQPA